MNRFERYEYAKNRWLDGAYVAMWKEFKKDVIFELPPQFEAGDDRNIDPYR